MGKCLFMRKGEVHTAPSIGILASDLAVGSVVKLMENGVAMEYLVVNQGKPSGSSLYDDSCDGTWLLRKDIHSNRVWDSTDNDYKNSDIHEWLNGTFFNAFGAIERSVIKQVKIPYVNGTGYSAVASGENGLSSKCFLLSGYEVGWTSSDNNFHVDGSKLEYFDAGTGTNANTKRIANLNETATTWLIRSIVRTDSTQLLWRVGYNGDYEQTYCTKSAGVRPALVLPSNAMFDTNTLILKGVA